MLRQGNTEFQLLKKRTFYTNLKIMTNNDVATIAGQECDIPNLQIVLQNILTIFEI